MADEEKTEAPEEEVATEDAPAPEATASDADAPPAAEAEVEPEAQLSPKERRQRARATKAAAQPTRPAVSPEERKAERDAARQRKAAVRSGWRKREREKRRAARTGTPEPVAARDIVRPGVQKTRQGIVVSDRAAKTITVRIDVTRRHPLYQKIVRTSSTLHVHDENSDAHTGDTVVVRECRPVSRTKRWRLVEVVERAK
jgi:small subunit ribosomal protein S17